MRINRNIKNKQKTDKIDTQQLPLPAQSSVPQVQTNTASSGTETLLQKVVGLSQ